MIADIEMLIACAEGEEFEEDFKSYIKEIIKMDGVKREDGYTCYVKENLRIVHLIPKNKIVVDVGCSFGLQHILYKDHKQYIGIQEFKGGINCEPGYKPIFKVFTKNAQIIRGMFKDAVRMLGITEENKDDYFGIANHSLWHDESANKQDIIDFKRSFPKNYYATNESGEIIEYNIMAKPKEKTTKSTKSVKVAKAICNHEWISGTEEGERYICKHCGEVSD